MIENHTDIKATACTVRSQDWNVDRALRESQFFPFFQPLVTLRTGQLAGFEVLARWQHPTEGLMLPSRFIPLAEQAGWIGALTEQVLTKAFAAASIIPEPLTLAINVSQLQLRDLQLPEQIRRMAEDAGFCMSRLVIEITESALIEDLQNAVVIVGELKAMGCLLALDDFGTGYSSLHHLQSLPFDMLKVDRSFVSSMIEKRDSRKIVSAVIGLGHSLGLITVAEGIETQEQAEMMLWLGCSLGQGFFYGHPTPAQGLAASIAAPREKIVTNDKSAWRRIGATNLDVSPAQRLAQLQAVYDGAPVGLAFVDQNLRYVNLNKRLADMNGAPVEDHLGSLVSEMVPELFPYVEPYIRRALEGEVITEVEAKIEDTGETRLLSYQPARDEAGEVIGVSIAATDITERKRMEDDLKASESHYRSMVELNPQVLWIMDPQGRNLDVSPRWDKVTGLMRPQSDHNWLEAIHPDDLRKTVRAIAESRRSGSTINVEYRVMDTAGGWKWKLSKGAPRFDVSGNIACWYGSVQDTTGPSELSHVIAAPPGAAVNVATYIRVADAPASASASEGEQRHQALFDLEILDTPPEAEFDDLVALASQICAVPISLVSLVGSDRQWFKASVGLTVCETPISSSFCAHAIEQQGLFQVEDAATDPRFRDNPLVLGEPKIRFYAGMPLYAGQGVAVGTLCVIDTAPRSLSASQAKALAILSQQVQARMELRSERRKLLRAIAENRQLTTELKEINRTLTLANAQLEQLATIDDLTGLLNRRAFEAMITVEFTTALRKQRRLALLLIDIDDFKKRNDQNGHVAGDAALRMLGEVLRNVLRAGDSAARIGGEEFAVVLLDTTPEQAVAVAKRLQHLLELAAAQLPPLLTLSIGIAFSEANMTSWEVLLSNADGAMYKAKRNGKNSFVISS